jgi:deoxyadenosine/deoxycytidine kinase
MKIILINGQAGTGKSTIANALKNELPNSAYIDADWLVSVNPFELEKLDGLMLQNALALINNFTDAGYENIITAGLARNQMLLDGLIAKLNGKANILFVWLRADRETRLSRKQERGRDGADSKEHFDFVDQIYPDVKSFDTKNASYLEIDTSLVNAQAVVEQIKSEI